MEVDESGNVTIEGRHGIGNNRFRRFTLTFKAPEDTEVKGIVGNLENGLYTVFFPKMAAVEAVQEAKLRECAEEADEKLQVPEAAAANETKTVSAAEETALEKALDSEIPEADKAAKTLESPTAMPHGSTTTMEETGAQEPETFTKPVETDTTSIIHAAPALPEANNSSEMTEPKNAAILSKQNQEPETFTKQAETDTDYGAKEAENATTVIDAAPALPKPNRSSEMTEPMTGTILSKQEGKADIKEELEEHQEIKKGGFLENMMEKINEHKVCIISAILAFSMGILLSRKIKS